MLDDAHPGGCLQIGYVDNQIEQFSGHAVAHIGVGGATLVDPIHGIGVAQDWAPGLAPGGVNVVGDLYWGDTRDDVAILPQGLNQIGRASCRERV